ncbi:MAG: hypothetical protein LBI10_00740, partial [Deltaproteobacteria bacterium]|nr:hypothetical protein [Deltaproteobacteria bacterium]
MGLFVKKTPKNSDALGYKTKGPSVGAVLARGFKLVLTGVLAFLVLVVLSVLMVGGFLSLSKSEYFAVKNLKITGLSHLTMD